MLRAGPKTGYDGVLPEIADDVEWFEFVTGKPLYQWQREELRKVLSPDRPRSYYTQVGRKNGKSYWGAAATICEARREQRHIYIVSDSEKNLQSALMREIRDIVNASPILSSAYAPFQAKFEVPSTGSFIETRPNKFAASQSINPHMTMFDEVHLQKVDDIWHGYRMAGAARRDGILIGITTPGQDIGAPAHGFYQQVLAGTMAGRIFAPANPDTAYEDRAEWRRANPRLLDDPEFMEALEEDFRDLPEHQFKRYRLGMWTAGSTAWLPYGAWDALKSDHTCDGPYYLGFDGSFSQDSTALVSCCIHGHLEVRGCWENPGKRDWRVPRAEVQTTIAELMDNLDVRLLLYDPPYWITEGQAWQQRWPKRVLEFPTNVRKRMAPACTTFYTGVMEKRLTHDGDPGLARHIANAVVRTSPEGDYITKADKDSPAKIDLAIAAVVAYSLAATTINRPRKRVFVL